MFDFVRKSFLWDAWDKKLDTALAKHAHFHLKSIQDLAVFACLQDLAGSLVAEIGGGDSRILRALAQRNRCFNVEKFEGADGGPADVIKIEGVKNIPAFLGEYSPELRDGAFDVVFSVSVLEHVPSDHLKDFLGDGLRILKRGGLWLHAIDLYLEDQPSASCLERYGTYKSWMLDHRLSPVGEVFDGPPSFSCDMATNPDNIMYSWGRVAPKLIPLRRRAQSVSLLVAARKR